MKSIRIETATLRVLHDNLVTAQDESAGWRDAIDEAKAELERLMAQTESPYPTAFSLQEVKISTNGRAGDHAVVEMLFNEQYEPETTLATLVMTPSEAKELIVALQEVMND